MHLYHRFLQIPGCPSHPLSHLLPLILNPAVVDRARDMVIIVVRIETSIIMKEAIITDPMRAVIQREFHVDEDDGTVGMNASLTLSVMLMVLDGVLVEDPAVHAALRTDLLGESHLHLALLDVDRSHLVPGTQSVVQRLERMSLVGIYGPFLPQNHLLQTPITRPKLILLSHRLFMIPKQNSRLRLRVMTRCLDPHR